MDYYIQCGHSWPQCLGMDGFSIYMFCHALRVYHECRHRATILVRQNHYGVNLYSMMGQSKVDMLQSADCVLVINTSCISVN